MTVGSQLGQGRYSVRGVLGEGGQGVTYEATGPDGRVFAIKRFDVRGARQWKDVELAERETRVLATLDHPLMPRYVEHFEEDGALFLVMEKVEGESLDAILRRNGALPEPEIRRFLRCADRALSYLHGRSSPIVHRDIKPRNVIRRPNGDYVFVDFGVVAERLSRHETNGGSTIVGTAGFMAPEQIQGRALPATDIYAVGATALAALAGQEPEALPHRGLRLDARAALAGRPVSAAMITALESMLEPDPTLRAQEVGVTLEATVSVPPPVMHTAPAASITPSEEDAMVKGFRRIVWVLWALSWCIVGPATAVANADTPLPMLVIQFMTLALAMILTWHKAYLFRRVIRRFAGTSAPAAPPVRVRIDAPSVQARVQVASGHFQHGAEHQATEVEPAPRRMTR